MFRALRISTRTTTSLRTITTSAPAAGYVKSGRGGSSSSSGSRRQSNSQRLNRFDNRDDRPRRRPDASGQSIAWRDRPSSVPQVPRPPRTKEEKDRKLPAHRQEANIIMSQPRDFSSFELNPAMQEVLAQKGYQKTTPIQSLALSEILASPPPEAEGAASRTAAILGAETGSGKTLAYLLPLMQRLKEDDRPGPRSGILAPRAIVLAPTHELTRQSTAVAKQLSHGVKLRVAGASSPGTVKGAGGVDILFSTGRRMAQLLGLERERGERVPVERKRYDDQEPEFSPARLEWLIIDEADVLLGSAFADETNAILRRLPRNVNVLLVTATLPPALLAQIGAPDSPLKDYEFDQLLSPGLHRLPAKLETRFVPWSKSGNMYSDIAHEVRRVFAEEALDAKNAAHDEEAQRGLKPGSVKPQRNMAVVFCSSLGKVAAVSKALEERDIKCLPWTGDSADRKVGRNGPLDHFLVDHNKRPEGLEIPKPPKQVATTDDGQPIAVTEAEAEAAENENEGEKVKKEQPESEKKKPRVLVTTSLLSRGLDFSPLVSTIYLVDPPRNVLDFVHRAGRAGRAGRPGRVVVFGLQHAGQSKYSEQLKEVLRGTERRKAAKPGARTFEGVKAHGGGKGGKRK
ncbi:RNA helicase [Trichosporon asahii var. asahii CBS 8904]|uniref:RNA helicase n=1 Tax=Trichosporon asahii var. asahii (strain CBS 8904) TaxID=1220162 RepID=K1V0I2_TRIAC|nr:RNA helicase [Trichosporon asahii var. asahii CBS 8904]